MHTTETARTPNAAGTAGTTAAGGPKPNPDLRPPLQLRERTHHRAYGSAMRDAMRNIVWITGAAFGIAPREAFSQSASARSRSPKDQA